MTGLHVLRRLLALVLAAALLLAAVMVVVEIVAAALGRPAWIVSGEDWANRLREYRWDDGVVRLALSGVLLLGLLLLTAGLYRGRPAELGLTSTEPGVALTASRRSVERVLAAAARSVPGVTSAKAAGRRRTVRVDAWSRLREVGDLRDRVDGAVQERIDALALSRPPRLTVRVRTEESR